MFELKHFDYLLSELRAHRHTERPHQGKDNQPLSLVEVPAKEDVCCSQRTGELLKNTWRETGLTS